MQRLLRTWSDEGFVFVASIDDVHVRAVSRRLRVQIA